MHTRAPELIFRDEYSHLMRWDDVFVSRWTGRASAAHVRRLATEHLRFVDAFPERSTLVLSHVDMLEVPALDEDVRRAVNEYDARIVPRLRASAIVFAPHGFGAVIIRGLLSGLSLMNRRVARTAVFATPDEGIAFLARNAASEPPPVDELVRVYRRACAELA